MKDPFAEYDKLPTVSRINAWTDRMRSVDITFRLDEAVSALGLATPEDLFVLYMANENLEHPWSSVNLTVPENIVETQQSLRRVQEQMWGDVEEPRGEDDGFFLTAKGPVAPLIYCATRIPFGDENQLDLLLDMVPPAGGTPGQVVRLDIEFGVIEVVAPSLREFFRQGPAELQTRKRRGLFSRLAGKVFRPFMYLGAIALFPFISIAALLIALGMILWSAVEVMFGNIADLFRKKR